MKVIIFVYAKESEMCSLSDKHAVLYPAQKKKEKKISVTIYTIAGSRMNLLKYMAFKHARKLYMNIL